MDPTFWPDVRRLTNEPSGSPGIFLTAGQVGTQPKVSHVAVEHSPFWPKHPNVGLMQMQAQFSMSNVSSQQARYKHLRCALPSEKVLKVSLTLIFLLCPTPYHTFKAAILVRRFSKPKRLHKRLSTEHFEDQRPLKFCGNGYLAWRPYSIFV